MQGNGYLGTRGAFEEVAGPDGKSSPLTLIAGIFDTPAREHMVTRLAPAPNWLILRFFDGTSWFSLDTGKILQHVRRLAYKDGLLTREVRWESDSGRVTKLVFRRFVSMARPHVCALCLEITPENYSDVVKVASEINYESWYEDGIPQTDLASKTVDKGIASVAVRTKEEGHTIAVAARTQAFHIGRPLPVNRSETQFGELLEFPVGQGEKYTIEKVVSFYDSMRSENPLSEAVAEVASLPRYSVLEKEQKRAWADYWKDADIEIEGDPFAQSVARFFVFELLQAASRANVDLNLDVSIAAKCLSGPGYNGHVFWDTELYMLPFFSLEYPEIAEKLLEYRFNRIPQARINAESEGGKGAKFPWESAGTGIETTPKWLPAGEGKMVRCWTGDREIHVIADVAFGAWQHYMATGSESFMERMGLQLIVETARYWAYRAKREDLGKGKYQYVIREVIPPNEYHECVDNSLFTNAMARWNILKALELLKKPKYRKKAKTLMDELGITEDELAHWKDVADHIRIPYDEKKDLYPECDGFFELEDVDLSTFDHTRHNERQIIKQADVLLALYLLPELTDPESFRRHYDYYVPRTDHGSSLSPGVHVLFSRLAGYPDKMYDFFQKAGSIDAAHRGHASDAGLHAASLGGGWQSLVFGFGGLAVTKDGLSLDPQLPKQWRRLKFSAMYKGSRLRFDIKKKSIEVSLDADAVKAVHMRVLGQDIAVSPGSTIVLMA
jgi:trehalose/maltose hydrolase-like predicted phosphorylase